MAGELIAVTGATGELGGRVARRLAAAGARLRLVVRDSARALGLPGTDTGPAAGTKTGTSAEAGTGTGGRVEVVAASYQDPTTMRAALAGVATLFLVSATEHPDRVGLHRTAVDAAVATGVTRIVYTSFVGAAPAATFTFARDHWHTEQHIRARVGRFTFLRNCLYQDVLPYFAGRAGVIRGPAGDGRVAAVTRDDIADVAAAVLLEAGHDGATYDLTGPAALTLAEVAAQLRRATGRPVRYQPQTLTEAYESRARYGAPAWEVAGWVTSYAAIATGEMAVVSDAVAQVSGHPATDFASFLAG